MKFNFLLVAIIWNLSLVGQTKYKFLNYNHLTDIEGTEYVIAQINNSNFKFSKSKNCILFLNTKNGEKTLVNFPDDSRFETIQQIKIDSLGINCILISAQTLDIDKSKGIGWDDPNQIIILSTDGKQKTQLTDSNLYVETWGVNKTTGTLVISGYYDTNSNEKHDIKDKNEIFMFDLKTLKLIRKINEY